MYSCTCTMYMYFLYRDQKTIDIENRANYVALKKRWGVLDVTIQIPEDEMLKSVPAYMEGSEDEEDCKLIPSTVDTQETVDSSSASSDTRDSSTSQDQPKDCQPPVSACSHQTCTNSTTVTAGTVVRERVLIQHCQGHNVHFLFQYLLQNVAVKVILHKQVGPHLLTTPLRFVSILMVG